MITNEPIDIWRERNASTRAFSFDKKQVKNRTRAQLDYHLISQNTQRYIPKAHIGSASTLSDHTPVYITISPSALPMGGGFWQLDNALLKDIDFLTEFNCLIKSVMRQY